MTYEEEIVPLRDEINRLNAEIVERLAERVRVAIEIGYVKHRHGKSVVDLGREEKVLNQARALAEEARIDLVGVEKVFREIIALCTQAELEEEA
jgi:chorismate mutase